MQGPPTTWSPRGNGRRSCANVSAPKSLRGLLAERGFLSIADVMAATGVSAASARRDAGRLAEAGLRHANPRRHPGGRGRRVRTEFAGNAGHPLVRGSARRLMSQAKRAIARQAVELCEDGDAVIINGGTTTFQMAQFLRDRRLKVLTNSYPLAEIADPRDREPRRAARRRSLSRAEADRRAVRRRRDHSTIRRACMFMSAVSIGAARRHRGRPADRSRREEAARTGREARSCWRTASKFAPRGSLVVCPLSRVDTLITDEAAPPEALAMLREAGVQDDRRRIATPDRHGGRMIAAERTRPSAAPRSARHREVVSRRARAVGRLLRRARRARCTRCSARTAPASRR